MDFSKSYRVFLDVVYVRGYLDKEISKVLLVFRDDVKIYYDFSVCESVIYG